MTTTDHAQDHIRIARDCLGMADKKPKKHLRSLAWSLAAQAHATLAVAEQLRIANLIALGSIGSAHRVLADQVSADAAKTLAEFHAHETPEVGGWWQLRPEIATRLGLDGGAE